MGHFSVEIYAPPGSTLSGNQQQDDCYTPRGKNEITEILHANYKNRDILGRIMRSLEAEFGEQIAPWLAYQSLDPAGRYSFGSVRRNQAALHVERGARVIEVVKPGVGPSEFEFDQYNAEHVEMIVHNDGTLKDLENAVAHAMRWMSRTERAA